MFEAPSIWRTASAAAAIALSSTFAVSDARSQDVDIDNVARKAGGNQYEWTAFVVADESDLKQIKCVVYTLHPTFPDPVQRICETDNPKYPFGLTVSGWGSFALRTKIEFKNGSSQEVVHRVRLQ
jgi:transcription initiation factor IIF auxiliary subunit